MKEQDVSAVAVIERMSFHLPWSEVSFLNEIYKPRAVAKVATLDGSIVGYICAEYVEDEGHILDLAVHPDFRRRGVATSLVRHVLEELRLKGSRFVYLEVRTSNNAAKELYERFGFRIVGMRKNYYVVPNEDAVIMMLEI